MLAVQKISGLIFALCIITAFSAPHTKRNHSLISYINELIKYGTNLFNDYGEATGTNRGDSPNSSNFPGLPDCTLLKASNQSQICDTLQPFERVFKHFNSSMSDGLMSLSDKKPLLDNISSILEVHRGYLKCTAPSSSNSISDYDHLTKKMMFHNAFKDYKECAEQLVLSLS